MLACLMSLFFLTCIVELECWPCTKWCILHDELVIKYSISLGSDNKNTIFGIYLVTIVTKYLLPTIVRFIVLFLTEGNHIFYLRLNNLLLCHIIFVDNGIEYCKEKSKASSQCDVHNVRHKAKMIGEKNQWIPSALTSWIKLSLIRVVWDKNKYEGHSYHWSHKWKLPQIR